MRPLEGYAAVIVQHVLGSSIPLFKCLRRSGVTVERATIIAKAYSSHPAAIRYLRESDGWRVVVPTGDLNLASYESYLSDCVFHLVSSALIHARDCRGLLIVDEGGTAIGAATRLHAEGDVCKAVEQTSRGTRPLERCPPPFPVVNVARCVLKRREEAPQIAKSMVDEFERSVDEWSDVRFIGPILLIGFGTIGEQVATEFRRRRYELRIYDSSPNRRARAKLKFGSVVETVLSDAIGKARVIVGCAGGSALDAADLATLQPNSLLVNMASSDIEFPATFLRSRGEVVYSRRTCSRSAPWGALFRSSLDGRNIFLVNGGFPVNFAGKLDSPPASEIQLTRAILLAGAIQAATASAIGLQELDRRVQLEIWREFRRVRSAFRAL